MAFRESLRDIEACLRFQQDKFYHLGFRSVGDRNTLSNANEKRHWRVYAEFAQILIHNVRQLYKDEDLGIELNNTL